MHVIKKNILDPSPKVGVIVVGCFLIGISLFCLTGSIVTYYQDTNFINGLEPDDIRQIRIGENCTVSQMNYPAFVQALKGYTTFAPNHDDGKLIGILEITTVEGYPHRFKLYPNARGMVIELYRGTESSLNGTGVSSQAFFTDLISESLPKVLSSLSGECPDLSKSLN